MKQMKYLKLFETNSEKAFWEKIVKNANINTYDYIYKYEDKLYDAENFEDYFNALVSTQEIYDDIEYSIYNSYIEELKKYLDEFPGKPFNKKSIELIFHGKPNSTNWSNDGIDPLIGYDDLSSACSNEYVHEFIQNNILDYMVLDKLFDYIKENVDNFTLFMDSKDKDWIHFELKDKIIKKLKEVPEFKYLFRAKESGLTDFQK